MRGRASQPTWVQFLSGPDDTALESVTMSRADQVNYYRIRDVIPVRGSLPVDLAAGWTVIRIETSVPLGRSESAWPPSTATIIQFHGVTEHLHYTSWDQRQELERRSATELEPSDKTIVVLILVRKSAEWWALAQDPRQAHFQETSGEAGHTAIGLTYADRVFRKLYQSRYLNDVTGYDFLTYFEFKDDHVESFRSLLTALRDPDRNPGATSIWGGNSG
jgi:hypothetical protein